MLQIRMEFDLIDRRNDFGGLEHSLQIFPLEIRHPDRLCFATLLDFLQFSPFLLEIFRGIGEEWSVNQVLIDVIEPEFLEGELECGFCILYFGA